MALFMRHLRKAQKSTLEMPPSVRAIGSNLILYQDVPYVSWYCVVSCCQCLVPSFFDPYNDRVPCCSSSQRIICVASLLIVIVVGVSSFVCFVSLVFTDMFVCIQLFRLMFKCCEIFGFCQCQPSMFLLLNVLLLLR